MARAAESEPMCPRCGYDQSGEPATWSDSCPVEGRCPECGHLFCWADLFDPSRRELPWSVESSGSGFRRLMRTPGMAVRMVLPCVYWKRVGVGKFVSPRRIIGWHVWFGLVFHLATWPIVFACLGVLWLGRWKPVLGDIGDVFSFFSFAQLFRLAINVLSWPIFGVELDSFRPWISLNVMDYGAFQPLRFMIGLCLTWCIVLTAIPVTRRMARLRFAHIARAALLQLAVIFPLYSLIRIGLVTEYFSFGNYVRTAIIILNTASVVWAIVWWISAVWVGWQVRSWGLTILGTIAALLGGLVAVLIDDSVSYMLGG